MSNYQYAPDEYIVVGKDNIDKVYSIIQYLPLETQMKIIFAWLASEGYGTQYIYESFDFDEPLGTYIDLVKEILTEDGPNYGYDNTVEQIEALREENEKNDNN